jgi:Family of unknown function (DUF6599)
MRLLLAVMLLPALAAAASLPDAIGAHARVAPGVKVKLNGQPLWNELGLKDAEAASYAAAPVPFTVSVFQLPDSTAALAAFDWQRPASSKPSKAAPLAAETPDSLLLVHGNYLLSFQGYTPSNPELEEVFAALQHVDRTALPTFYLPEAGKVPNSERYITGPAGLHAFLPGIPLSAAAFQLGAEAQSAVFHSPAGDVTLAVFNYPTPQIAMQQAAEFEKAGLTVKRSVSLVSVVLPGADPGFAQSLLSQVRYKADVTLPEHIPTLRDNIGNLVINIFILIGILLSMTLVAGLAVGALRAYQRRGGRDPDADTVIRLHLE